MIKITKLEHLEQVSNLEIATHLKRLLVKLFDEYSEYCSDSIDALGAIFVLEHSIDWHKYLEIGLCSPINNDSFEWILPLNNTEYKIGCINIDTNKSINIVAKSSLFATFCE